MFRLNTMKMNIRTQNVAKENYFLYFLNKLEDILALRRNIRINRRNKQLIKRNMGRS